MNQSILELDKTRVVRIIRAALKEDIGRGDITTSCVVHKLKSTRAMIVPREECVMCGLVIAEWILSTVDYSVRFKPQVRDGDIVHSGEEVAFVEGHARAILLSERLILNFISILSGIASETKRYVDKVRPYGVEIFDTRKTIPLFRYLEKYAVTVGGGRNHRMNLGEMVMVKDNHYKVSDTGVSVKEMRKKLQRNIKIEVEIDTIREYERMLLEKPDIIMLDNMKPADVEMAVTLKNKHISTREIILEASGGITLDNVEEYAKTGVNRISIGAITDSIRGMDFSLEII